MSEETTTTSTESVIDAVVASIGSAGTADYKPVPEILKSKQSATPEAKPAEKPVAAESQTEAESKVQSDTTVTEEKKTEPQEKVSESKESKVEAKPEDEVDPLDVLGLKQPAMDYQKAYSESSREGKRLAEERKHIENKLKELGLELVNTEKGIDFNPTDKAFERAEKEIDESSVKAIWDKLTKQQQELLDKDTFMAAAKQVAVSMQVKKPVVQPKSEDRVLASHEVDSIFNTLASETLSNKSPRYPDLLSKEVQDIMVQVYQADEAFRKWMNQSPDNFKSGAKKLYAEAWRVIAPKKAALALAEQKKKQDEQEKNKGPDITSKTGASQSHKTMSAEDKIIAQIGGAKRS